MSQNTSRITPGLVQGGLVQRKKKQTPSSDEHSDPSDSTGTSTGAHRSFILIYFHSAPHSWLIALQTARSAR
jgi:hypothetical protein